MLPIHFQGQNLVIAEDQPEYQPLPAHLDRTTGMVTTCWQLSDTEKAELLRTGRLYLQVLTFNQPLQPVMLHATNPLVPSVPE